ncbi:MAG: NUDIX hydrolase [Ruminococcaceae bacterium]|nr:NUDIX hydrolase [Oscillospiraceae bacterium]
MLAKNKSGWKLLEYIDIDESDIYKYNNVTGAYAILIIDKKFVIWFNSWRNQWEFPSGGIEAGETARQAAIRELYEETHQKAEKIVFKGLIKVEDPNGYVKHQAVFVGCQNELYPFIHEENDEMDKIYLWDMKEDIGYVDECDIKIVEIVC